ncbi:multicopper oxidase domain-containing protein [Paenarthrobacter nitroguajacolicus]|uniref:multicopper oxidase domain-containing protein n=1 Tax=Paenarthrobacter nitroguajacolicus TaxID=211146 RepID=UPI000AE62166
MTATKTGIVAYDGELRSSPDGKTWNTVAAMFAPAVLAGHPDRDTILGTTTDHFPGRTVFHCHILDHEDQGMMATVQAI